jgi:hypothetical protein
MGDQTLPGIKDVMGTFDRFNRRLEGFSAHLCFAPI